MTSRAISIGTLEALKWLGLVLMTGDHINKYLFNGTIPYLFEAGRLAMPIFVFVLAYNLARPGQLGRKAYQRTMKRLTVFGGIASIPFIGLSGLYNSWWPLNILFTLLALTAITYLIDRGSLLAATLVFVIAGSSVEYWWPALLFGIAIWLYVRKPNYIALVIALISCAGLTIVNHNMWAMATFPVFISAYFINMKVPRFRWAFYFYYPLHLGILWLIRIPMSRAGYLFF